MISFREYHKQMEILNEEKKSILQIKSFLRSNERKERKSGIQSLGAQINNGDLNLNDEDKKELLELINKISPSELEGLGSTVNNIKEKLSAGENGNDSVTQDEADALLAEPPSKEKEKGEENKEETKSKSEFKNDDVESDYQWLFDNKEEISNLIKDRNNIKAGLSDVSKKLVFYFIVSDIAYQKLLRIFNDDDKTNVEINTGSNVPFVIKLSNGKNYSYENTGEKKGDQAGKAFLDILNNLKKFKFKSSSISLSDKVKDYVNSHKDLDLNKPSERQKVLNDVKNDKVFNKSNHQDQGSGNTLGGSYESGSDDKTTNLGGSDDKTTSLGSGSGSKRQNVETQYKDSEENKELQSKKKDPDDVSSLSVTSTIPEIERAVAGTFGTSDQNPGSIYRAQMERALKAKEKIAAKVQKDNDYINGAKDRKKELREDVNVILKELQSNPLLKKEKDVLLEKMFGPDGERAKSRWDKLENDNGKSFINRTRKFYKTLAGNAVTKMKDGYVDNYKKASLISKIKKYASTYNGIIDDRISDIIRKNDYGFISSFVRDSKVARRDRIDAKNEVYANSREGIRREAIEKETLENLEKISKNTNEIDKQFQKSYKNLLSLCAYATANILEYSLPVELPEDIIGIKIEKGTTIKDKIISLARSVISPGITDYGHLGTLIKKGLKEGKYTNLASKSDATILERKIRNYLEQNERADDYKNQANDQNNAEEKNQSQDQTENNTEEKNKTLQIGQDQISNSSKEEKLDKNSSSYKNKMVQLSKLDQKAKKDFSKEDLEQDKNRIEILSNFSEDKLFYKENYSLIRKILANIVGYKTKPNDTVWFISQGETKYKNIEDEKTIINYLKSKQNEFGWTIDFAKGYGQAKTQELVKELPAANSAENEQAKTQEPVKELPAANSAEGEQKIRSLIANPNTNKYAEVKAQIQKSNLDDNKKQILMKDLLVREILNKQKSFDSLKGTDLGNEINSSEYLDFLRDLNTINNKKFRNKIVKDPQNGKQYKWDNGKISEVTDNQQSTKDQEAATAIQTKYIGSILMNKIRDSWNALKNKSATNDITKRKASVVTEGYILTEDGEPISKSGAETAVLKALSLNAQEAAEGKQWIIDNIYKGNPLASKIVDKFVEENSNKRNQAAKVLAADKQAKQQAVNNGTPQQVATAMQGTGADTTTAQMQAAQQTSSNSQIPAGTTKQQGAPVVNNAAPTTTAPQQQANNQQQPQATVSTAAADGFPNRLYKKIIRRKIGM